MVDAVLAALILFLLLAVLGTMREAVILRGDLNALERLITVPPESRLVGRPVDALLKKTLAWTDHPQAALAFLSGSCTGCNELVNDLALAPSTQLRERLTIVVSPGPSSADMVNRCRALSFHVVSDTKQAIAKSLEVRSTPSLFSFSAGDTGWEITDTITGGSVHWLADHLQLPVLTLKREV